MTDDCPKCKSVNTVSKGLIRLFNSWFKRFECAECKFVWDKLPNQQERLDWNGE